MKRDLVFTKTAKGLAESVGKTKDLPRGLRELLKFVDGQASVDDLRAATRMGAEGLQEGLEKLLREEYIREFRRGNSSADEFAGNALGRFQQTLSQVTQDTFKRIMDGRNIRNVADADANAEHAWQMAAVGKALEEVDTQGLAESVRKLQQEFAARHAAEERVAEAKSGRPIKAEKSGAAPAEGHDAIFREIEELARKEEADVVRRDREAGEWAAAEERRRLQTEEYERKVDEERARRRAKRRARREAREKARQDHLAARQKEKRPLADRALVKLGDLLRDLHFSVAGKIGIGLPILLLLCLVTVQFVPFTERTRSVEKKASDYFGQPVRIGALHVLLLPWPHWHAEDVSIGAAGQIRISAVNAGIGTDLFSRAKAFAGLEVVSPEINDEGLGWLLYGAGHADGIRSGPVSIKRATLKSALAAIGEFDAHAEIDGEGRWHSALIDTVDREMHIELQLEPKDVTFDMTAGSFALPFGAGITLDQFHATGMLGQGEMRVKEFRGGLQDGTVSGNAMLTWWRDWSLSGDFKVVDVGAAKLAPHLFEEGRVSAAGKYFARAESGGKLLSSPRVVGNFTIANGVLHGVDLMTAARDFKTGGRSVFTELSGGFGYTGHVLQLHGLRMRSNLIAAAGEAEVDATGKLEGTFAVDVTAPSAPQHVDLSLGGSLGGPQFAAH